MICFSPVSIMDPSQANPAIRLEVPCGKCFGCKTNKREDWAVRLKFELQNCNRAYFLTLTYSDEFYPKDGKLSKRDIQLFFKRLRKADTSVRYKYFAVGEYGELSKRAHYHVILFVFNDAEPDSDKDKVRILKAWNQGLIHFGSVTEASVRYTLKYILKSSENIKLMSKNLGLNYVTDRIVKWHKADLSRNFVTKESGLRTRLPRYYRDKIYTKREKLKQNALYQAKCEQEWSRLDDSQKSDFVREIHIKKKRYEERRLRQITNINKNKF